VFHVFVVRILQIGRALQRVRRPRRRRPQGIVRLPPLREARLNRSARTQATTAACSPDPINQNTSATVIQNKVDDPTATAAAAAALRSEVR